MDLFIIITISIAAILLGRALLHRWFNQITLYVVVWSVSLLFFQFRLLNYYPLETETWIVILDGFLAFVFGTITVFFARFATQHQKIQLPIHRNERYLALEVKILPRVIWVLSIISLMAVLQHWYVLLKMFGSIQNVVVMGGVLYAMRLKNAISGTIPYLGALALPAMLFAGRYASVAGRFRPVVIVPIVTVVIGAVSDMGRANLFISGLLFLSGYMLSKTSGKTVQTGAKAARLQKVLTLLVGAGLLIGTAELVRSNRGMVESIEGASPTLQRLQAASFITPSIYEYFTIHHGVLNQYLKLDQEHPGWGENTFGPVYRILSKFGFDTYTSDYPLFYRTPIGANSGTYLRELHADFGVIGILIVPYLLGLLGAWVWYRRLDDPSCFNLVIIAHLFVVIAFSLIVQATRLGFWWISLIVASFSAYYLDRKLMRAPEL
jgi:oligosaccharide repeat unit polymerase